MPKGQPEESVPTASQQSDTSNLEAFVEQPQESIEEVAEAERRQESSNPSSPNSTDPSTSPSEKAD